MIGRLQRGAEAGFPRYAATVILEKSPLHSKWPQQGFKPLSCSLMEKATNWWKPRRFGCISLALSLAEIAAIGIAILVVRSSIHQDVTRIQSVAADAWFLGGVGSLGCAVAGLVADAKRFTAFLAIILTLLAFVICGTQFLV